MGSVNKILGFINSLIRAWNGIRFDVPTITLPSATLGGGTFLGKTIPSVTVGGGTIGGQSFSVPQLPLAPLLRGPIRARPFAEGGIVSSPTLAIIGEAGPEAVVPLDRRGGMGTVININVEGSIVDTEGLAEPIADVLLLLRRQGLAGI